MRAVAVTFPGDRHRHRLMRPQTPPPLKLSAPSRPASRRRRPRARVRRAPTGVAVVLGVVSLLAGASMLDVDVGAEGGVVAGPVPAAEGAAPPAASPSGAGGGRSADQRQAPAGRPPVFARHEGVTLRLPAAQPLGLRFTQGRLVGAVPLEPLGTLTANANPQGFDASQAVETANGPEFAVASPAGRGRPATSAAIVSLRGGTWVRAPLTGTVVDVRQPPTEVGTGWRLVLQPDIRPELRVSIYGLHQPRLGPGDTVTVGETIAAPRLIRPGLAEVGIEMRPARAPINVQGGDALESAPQP